MELFREYLLESQGSQLVEAETWFFSYRIAGEQFYISDFHVSGGIRVSREPYRQLMREILFLAYKNGCTWIGGHRDLSAPNVSEGVSVFLRLGFKILFVENNRLAFRLKLSEVPAWLRVE